MEKIPCLKPWDIVFGEAWNVLTRGHILLQLAQEGRIDVFLGLPCQSFTFAREPALRDAAFPMGKPNLSPKQQALVDTGNSLSDFALVLIETVDRADRLFAVENPYNS